MDIKKILYGEIDNIGKEKIGLELEKDINLSKKIITIIFQNSLEKIYDNSKDIDVGCNDFETIFLTLAESLLHFLLTVAMYPSQRKVTANNIKLDIVIPDLKTLNRNSSKSLIIQFSRKDSYLDVLDKITIIQRNPRNIWSVSTSPIENNFKYKNYVIDAHKEWNDNNHFSLNKFNLKHAKNLKNMENEIIDIRLKHGIIHNTNLLFSHIIIDINKFLKDTNNKSFKFLPY